MSRRLSLVTLLVLGLGMTARGAVSAEDVNWQQGAIELQSVGPLAFAPDGVLLLADPMAATLYAIDTGDDFGDPEELSLQVDSIDVEIADLMGTESSEVVLHDIAVNPASGNVYVSVTRGQGNDAVHAVFFVNDLEELDELPLTQVQHTATQLPNAPSSDANARRGDPRAQSITDLAFSGGRVYIAGLSNEEFASNLRSVPFPFEEADGGTSVEIYHGAHGRFETEAPVRTFAFFDIDEKPYMLAAYTCTPLVKIPLDELHPGAKVRGTTIAELGSGNRPLDMVVYRRDDQDYVLLANSRRGMMKITTDGIGGMESIEEPIQGLAGLTYETINDLEGVVQMDQLNAGHVVILRINEPEGGTLDLVTVALP